MQINSYMALLETFARFLWQKLVTFLRSASWDPWLHRSCLTSSSAACTEIAKGNLYSHKPSIDKCMPSYFDNLIINLFNCAGIFKVRWEIILFTLLCGSMSTLQTERPSLTCRHMGQHRHASRPCLNLLHSCVKLQECHV